MPHYTPLIDFISDFELLNKDGIVVFDAALDIFISDITLQSRSEVHIITSIPATFCTIYLVHTDVRINDIPSMFTSDKHHFKYITKQYLQIEGSSIMNEKFIINIIPDIIIKTADAN